jgi:hypothetical protein
MPIETGYALCQRDVVLRSGMVRVGRCSVGEYLDTGMHGGVLVRDAGSSVVSPG